MIHIYIDNGAVNGARLDIQDGFDDIYKENTDTYLEALKVVRRRLELMIRAEEIRLYKGSRDMEFRAAMAQQEEQSNVA